MKTKFSWYFRPSDEEIDKIWNEGILTVDANVLLDLYRYHERTRNSLITSLQKFKGRLWLSHQACEEFIRNRAKVIISSEKTFKQANEEIDKLRSNYESTISQLKGNRIIPAEVADSLLAAIAPAIEQALSKIDEAKKNYPKYLQDDPILEQLSSMFLESTGEGFKDEDLITVKKEAEERKSKKIPPGYLDEDKDGERPYGDFFLWHQIIQHSKNKEMPIIFVTSERKEDWWEKVSGRTVGPRLELLREAHEAAGQRIMIYQTDQFLEYALKRYGEQVDTSAVEEIRAVDTLRFEIKNAVELIEHRIKTSSPSLNEGELILKLRRPVKNLTGSGHFNPRMLNIPRIETNLIESPPNMPEYRIRAGAGTTSVFNLHIISSEYDVLLPVGQYIFEYKASCQAHVNEAETVSDSPEDITPAIKYSNYAA